METFAPEMGSTPVVPALVEPSVKIETGYETGEEPPEPLPTLRAAAAMLALERGDVMMMADAAAPSLLPLSVMPVPNAEPSAIVCTGVSSERQGSASVKAGAAARPKTVRATSVVGQEKEDADDARRRREGDEKVTGGIDAELKPRSGSTGLTVHCMSAMTTPDAFKSEMGTLLPFRDPAMMLAGSVTLAEESAGPPTHNALTGEGLSVTAAADATPPDKGVRTAESMTPPCAQALPAEVPEKRGAKTLTGRDVPRVMAVARRSVAFSTDARRDGGSGAAHTAVVVAEAAEAADAGAMATKTFAMTARISLDMAAGRGRAIGMGGAKRGEMAASARPNPKPTSARGNATFASTSAEEMTLVSVLSERGVEKRDEEGWGVSASRVAAAASSVPSSSAAAAPT